jgi:hypothetical protein
VDTLPSNTALQNKALAVANNIMNVFRKGDPSDIRRARTLAEDIFGKGWEAKGANVYKEGAQQAQIIGCGNCHVSVRDVREIKADILFTRLTQHGINTVFKGGLPS